MALRTDGIDSGDGRGGGAHSSGGGGLRGAAHGSGSGSRRRGSLFKWRPRGARRTGHTKTTHSATTRTRRCQRGRVGVDGRLARPDSGRRRAPRWRRRIFVRLPMRSRVAHRLLKHGSHTWLGGDVAILAVRELQRREAARSGHARVGTGIDEKLSALGVVALVRGPVQWVVVSVLQARCRVSRLLCMSLQV